MELYTFLSLCIGIFGATYAGLNACRTHLEYFLKDICERGKIAFETYSGLENVTDKARGVCTLEHEAISKWRGRWNTSHVIPAVIFFVTMATISIWAIADWDNVMKVHADRDELAKLHQTEPWIYFKPWFIAMCSLNMCAIFLAGLSLCRCWMLCKGLEKAQLMAEPKVGDPSQNGSTGPLVPSGPPTPGAK